MKKYLPLVVLGIGAYLLYKNIKKKEAPTDNDPIKPYLSGSTKLKLRTIPTYLIA